MPKSHQPRHLNGMIRRVVRTHRRRADPGVPVQGFGNRGRIRRAIQALGPDRPVRPDVDLLDVTQLASLDIGRGLTQTAVGRALVAHLRGNFHLLGDFAACDALRKSCASAASA